MTSNFEQISLKPGFMKHNGGLFFRNISETEYEFKSTINENHLNAAGITHGGYLSALIDAGAGTAAHRASGDSPCVTISLDLKFIRNILTSVELIIELSPQLGILSLLEDKMLSINVDPDLGKPIINIGL